MYGVLFRSVADIDGIDLWDNIRTGSPSARTEFVYNIDNHTDARMPEDIQAAIRYGMALV
jgi:hypothetical protein